ncbi:hypothetical protein C7378_0417 [Acidipila rosea]|uniref:Uncharacterized protein n=1 Tax=Acidipila rosea TaxID=768535 RepID=A0A4R1LBC5_9BACT|nr:hypothetical protein C7378_0417 [Acidipila rosea]
MSFLHKFFNFFVEICLGCSHNKLTRPFTLNRETYKVCLDCGRRVYYSTETMRPMGRRQLRLLRKAYNRKLPQFQVNTTVRAMLPTDHSESSAAA